VRSYNQNGTPKKYVYLNTGSGWVYDKSWSSSVPSYFSSNGIDLGMRLGDVNGDGLVDFVRSYYQGSAPKKYVYLNTVMALTVVCVLPMLTVMGW
jgi:hypothetical protein